MNRSTSALIRLLGFALALSAFCAVVPTAAAQFEPWSGSSIVADPEWQKRFLGSYGFLSGAEPEINGSEVEILKEVIDLMQVNPRAAASMLEQRVGADTSAAVDFILANLRFQNGDLPAAEKSYEAALAKFPDFRRARKNLGLLMVQESRFDKAIEHLTKAIELGDRDGRSYGLLGYAFVNRENFLAAEAAYRQAILQQPDTKDWQLGLARSLLAQQRYAEAASLFSSYLEKNPRDWNAWKLQANAYLGLDQPRAAAVNLEAVRMLGKADAPSLVLLGDIYMNEGIAELAKDAYLDVIGLDDAGKQFKAAYRAADLLERSQAYPEAQEIVAAIHRRYAKNLSTNDELQLMTLESKLLRAQGKPNEAAKLLEEIVRRDGTRGEALLELARYHRDQGDAQKALLLLDRAGNLEDFEYPALIERAQHQVAAKEYEKAASALRKALRIKQEPRVERFLARVEEASRR
jgi:tetratricopeptide (TPR) repeat protein